MFLQKLSELFSTTKLIKFLEYGLPHTSECITDLNSIYGLYINDVKALGGRGQGFCDDSTKALVLNSITVGEESSKIARRHLLTTINEKVECQLFLPDSFINLSQNRHDQA